MSGINKALMAPGGTTGNNTHQSIGLNHVSQRLAFMLIVEAVGATPTVTWKVQVSADDTSIADASSTWVDLLYFTPGTNDTPSASTRVMTAVGSDTVFADTANDCRFWRKARLITSLNTNCTYRGECLSQLKL